MLKILTYKQTPPPGRILHFDKNITRQEQDKILSNNNIDAMH
jgi:hypothetical protein